MQQIITILIIAVCVALLVRMAIVKLRRPGCGCGEGKECRTGAGCADCGLHGNCPQYQKPPPRRKKIGRK